MKHGKLQRTETPTDPNDPTKITIETIVILPENKAKSISLADFWGNQIKQNYEPLNAGVIAKMNKMDEEMKIEYEKSKAVYDGLK